MSKRVQGFIKQVVEIDSPLFGREWFKNSMSISGKVIFPDDEVLISERVVYEFVYLVDTNRYDLNERREPFLIWKTFADDMPPQTGEVFLSDIPRSGE